MNVDVMMYLCLGHRETPNLSFRPRAELKKPNNGRSFFKQIGLQGKLNCSYFLFNSKCLFIFPYVAFMFYLKQFELLCC